ncbi:DUF993 family protein [Mycetocola zhujimingii]|uniref:DUF993 family protein n=1 Tax=Mycetocola zhujimingii TaxID=2079792 RepID=UPI0018E074D6|nr:DUF993 family protein [Mycetocola zhujimingii]
MTTAMTATQLTIPRADGTLVSHSMHEARDFPKHPAPFTSRSVFAAPHVTADIRKEYTPGAQPPVDWDATIRFRQHLFSYGIGVAEAMDTSERGPGGLDWSQAKQLITLGSQAAKDAGAQIVSGAGTDQLTDPNPSLQAVVDAYLEQLDHVESQGGSAVIRASHALVAAASNEDDYLWVYGQVLSQAKNPVIVHWLGTVFDPTLEGYWGHTDIPAAMEVVLRMARDNESKLRGIKFSLLDDELEQHFRRQVPQSIRVFTGDDYGYTDLLLGDGEGPGFHHSHGLLGVLDPIAPIASVGFAALDSGDRATFKAELDSTIPLAVKMFEKPAASYKVGVVFIAWLSGHQDHYRMVTGREGMRSLQHLTDLFVGTDALGLFPDPELSAHRMRNFLAVNGVE